MAAILPSIPTVTLVGLKLTENQPEDTPCLTTLV